MPAGDSSDNVTPVDILSCFEDRAFIHVTALPPTDDGTDVLRYSLVRYRLAFELRGQAPVLECVQHRGWHVRSSAQPQTDKAQPSLPPGLGTFLLLESPSTLAETRVLIPCERFIRSEDLSQIVLVRTEASTAQLRYYQHRVHAVTGMLTGPSVESRLHLAALYAATGSALPLPMLEHTGGEMALELVRQCAGNAPLSRTAQMWLECIARFGGHTPALRLASNACAQQHSAVSFLFSQESMPGPVATSAQEHALYLQTLQRAPPPFVNVRTQLTALERDLEVPGCSAANGPTDTLRDVADWRLAESSVGSEKVQRLQKKVLQLAQDISVPSDMARAKVLRARALLDVSTDQTSQAGAEYITDLEASFSAYEKAPQRVIDQPSLERCVRRLRALAAQASRTEQKLRKALLAALDTAPGGASCHAVQLMRACGFVATPAVSDLVLLAMPNGLLEVCGD